MSPLHYLLPPEGWESWTSYSALQCELCVCAMKQKLDEISPLSHLFSWGAEQCNVSSVHHSIAVGRKQKCVVHCTVKLTVQSRSVLQCATDCNVTNIDEYFRLSGQSGGIMQSSVFTVQ